MNSIGKSYLGRSKAVESGIGTERSRDEKVCKGVKARKGVRKVNGKRETAEYRRWEDVRLSTKDKIDV